MGTISFTYQEVYLTVWGLIFGVGPISRRDILDFMSNIPGENQLEILPVYIHRALTDLEDETLIISKGDRRQIFSVTPLGSGQIKKQLHLVSGLNQSLRAIKALALRQAQVRSRNKADAAEHPSHPH